MGYKIGVYTITHVASGRVYVGSSVDIDSRWAKHRQDLARGAHHSAYLQRTWSKYGAAQFAFARVGRSTKATVRAAECRVIKRLSPVFNSLRATTDGVLQHSEETKAKMSQSQLARYRRDGARAMTEQTKAKIASSHRGKKHSSETRAAMKAAALRRKPRGPFTAEHRANMSKAQRGRKFTAEHRANLSKARRRFLRDEVD